ncbi:MAG: hypothetical protein K9M44_04060 [Candidatus Pacebacteria bacterium]|nr:hypothetical protein [Candidatus Paceibacterota bacterium]
MSKDNSEPLVYRRAYELVLIICRFVKDLSPNYRNSIGLILQKEALNFIHSVYNIRASEDKKLAILKSTSSLYFMRTIVSLLLDLNAMKLETNVLINEHLEKSLSQLSAWQKNC